MSDDVTVVEINNTVTIVEDNYTVHILEGMGPAGSFNDGPVDYVDFNTAAASAYLAGRLRWNDTYHAPEFDTADGGTFIIGQGMPVWAVNKTGAPLAEGTPVYISDAQGQSPTILVAEQTDGTATARTIGLVKVEIANNVRGPVATFGPATGLDTSALDEGKRVWVGIGGDVTSTEPVWPAHNMRIGYCIYSHANQGIILVSTQKGFHLEHLYEVNFSGEAADDIMVRQANGQWNNVPFRELSDPYYLDHEYFVDDGVLDGWLPVATSGLEATEPAGSGVIESHKVETVVGSVHTNTALKDTYVDMTAEGDWVYTEVANGAGAPPISGTNQRLAKVVTDGTDITSVVDLRTMVKISSAVLPEADGGGGDWTEIARDVVTGAVSSVDFVDKLTGDYTHYELQIVGGVIGSSSEIIVQLGSGASPVFVVSGYTFHNTYVYPAAGVYLGTNSGNTDGFPTIGSNMSPDSICHCRIQLFDTRTVDVVPSYEAKGHFKDPASHTSNFRTDGQGSLNTVIDAFDHIRIKAKSGNLTAGTYILRGRNP